MDRPTLRMRHVLLALIAAASACKKEQVPAQAPVPVVSRGVHEDPESEKVHPVYPVESGPADPVAKRLCDALHALPETRKAQCCKTAPSSQLAGECVRMLTVALGSKAVTLATEDVNRCAEASARALDGCEWVTPLSPPVAEACLGIVHGQLAAGARCRSALECKEGLRCLGSGPTEPGICAGPGAPGQPCGGSVDPLVTYTRQTGDEGHPECTGWCGTGRCAAFAARGQSCSSNSQCARGLHCTSGRCVAGPTPGLGEACTGTTCDRNTICLQGKCVALKRAGEPCTNPFECVGSCVISAGSPSGTCGMKCSAWPLEGSPKPMQPTRQKSKID